VKEQIDRRIRDNRRISTDETVSEMSMMKLKKLCKNDIRPNRKKLYSDGIREPTGSLRAVR
jgi:hypothetical protein